MIGRSKKWVAAVAGAVLLATAMVSLAHAQDWNRGGNRIRHVLLISIDGMHALDFINCSKGIGDVNGGKPYCPNLAELATTGVNYLDTATSKPSDSFPGLMALVTGGSPRTVGAFYDVAFDRSFAPPLNMTKASISTRPSSTAAHPPATAVLPPSTPPNSCAIPQATARPSIPGTSSAPTQFSASFTPRAVTPHGPTNIPRTPQSTVPATAPT